MVFKPSEGDDIDFTYIKTLFSIVPVSIAAKAVPKEEVSASIFTQDLRCRNGANVKA